MLLISSTNGMTVRMDRPSWTDHSFRELLAAIVVLIALSDQLVLHTFAQSKSSDAPIPAVPRIQRTDLLNGLRILAVERPGETAVVNLLIKTGSFADPKDKAGVAYLTAQSVCFGNAKTSFQRWKDELEFLNARVEIRVNHDSTVFQGHLPSSNVDALLTLFTRLIVRPVFTEEGLERIKCELRSSKLALSEPQQIGKLRLGQMVFGRSACARPEWGTPESVSALRIADLEAFHRTYYLPNNTALMVVGGPPMARLGDLVREKLGSWIKRDLPPAEPAPAPILANPAIRVIDRKNSSEAVILVGHAGPLRQTPDFFALTLANTLLGGLGKASRLEQAFTERNISYRSLSSDLQFGQACSQFQVRAEVPLASLQATFQAILDCIEDIKTHPISDTELSRAKSALSSRHAASVGSEAPLADEVTAIELFDLSRDFLARFPLRVEHTSAERVQEAAKNYLSSTRISGIVVGESQAAKSALAHFRSFELSEWQESGAKPASAN